MPEDQGINGDRWTEKASMLLKNIGWEKIADSNIDVPGVEGLMHGIDSIFKYYDGARLNWEGVFVEAKYYQTSSFRMAKLQDWVTRLDEKIYSLSRSDEFLSKYPLMAGAKTRNGLLTIWFKDTENFPAIKKEIVKEMKKIVVSRSRNPSKENRLFILLNDDLLRIASLVSVMDKWGKSFPSTDHNNSIRITYPSVFKNPVQEQNSLHIEYLFSKMVFASGRERSDDGTSKDVDILFYFGRHSFDNYQRIINGMLLYNFLKSNTKLYIYQYRIDDEFRKIEPDLRGLLEKQGYPQVEFRPMNIFSEIPDLN